jgi:transposase
MMVTMAKRYPPEVREKAVRLALDRLDEYVSAYAAAHVIGPMVDVHSETLRVWIVKALQQDTPPVAGGR